jgi:hypothetical protein
MSSTVSLGACAEEGFGVGHTRLTQTKGVWIWGEPLPLQLPGGDTVNVRKGIGFLGCGAVALWCCSHTAL